jgi:hypothetical protein
MPGCAMAAPEYIRELSPVEWEAVAEKHGADNLTYLDALELAAYQEARRVFLILGTVPFQVNVAPCYVCVMIDDEDTQPITVDDMLRKQARA